METAAVTVGIKKKFPFPFRFSSRFCRSVPFTSVLTVCHGQTVLALGMNSSAKFTVCVGEALRDYFQRLDQEMVFSYHEKGYGPRPIALFIAGVRAGPRGDGSARAYLYFLCFIIYRMYYIFRESSGSYGQSFLASGDLKTRLTLRARSIDRSISRYITFIHVRESRLNERNGTERAKRDGKNHPFFRSKTERERKRELFFDAYCIFYFLLEHTYSLVILHIIWI